MSTRAFAISALSVALVNLSINIMLAASPCKYWAKRLLHWMTLPATFIYTIQNATLVSGHLPAKWFFVLQQITNCLFFLNLLTITVGMGVMLGSTMMLIERGSRRGNVRRAFGKGTNHLKQTLRVSVWVFIVVDISLSVCVIITDQRRFDQMILVCIGVMSALATLSFLGHLAYYYTLTNKALTRIKGLKGSAERIQSVVDRYIIRGEGILSSTARTAVSAGIVGMLATVWYSYFGIEGVSTTAKSESYDRWYNESVSNSVEFDIGFGMTCVIPQIAFLLVLCYNWVPLRPWNLAFRVRKRAYQVEKYPRLSQSSQGRYTMNSRNMTMNSRNSKRPRRIQATSPLHISKASISQGAKPKAKLASRNLVVKGPSLPLQASYTGVMCSSPPATSSVTFQHLSAV